MSQVSIPNRDLWVFRQVVLQNQGGSETHVSIPNRDLWVFRRALVIARFYPTIDLFQSLIGIYGFSGFRLIFQPTLKLRFQSLIGIYGFSGAKSSLSPLMSYSVSIPNRDLWVFRLIYQKALELRAGRFNP